MKDGSDIITGCSRDGENKVDPPVSSCLDKVSLEEKPISPNPQSDQCDAGKALPEFPHTWGDFEGFNEFTPESEEFYYEGESLPFDSLTTTISNGEHYAEQTDIEDGWDAFNTEFENPQECEHIFKLSFPDPLVEEPDESVKTLDVLLMSSNNNVASRLIKTRLWLDCYQSESEGNTMISPPVCDWQKSQACRDLMLLLSVSAEHTSNNNKITDALTEFDTEQSQVNETLRPTGNTSLIQTKLDVVPGSKHGHIFSYQLFLKKPSADVVVPFFTFSGKKSFFSTNH